MIKNLPNRKAPIRPILREFGERWRTIKSNNSPCTLEELVLLSGLTRAKLNNLHKTELVPQIKKYSKSRSHRPAVYYSAESVLRALIISEMRQAKFSFRQIRRAIKNLEKLGFNFDSRTHLLTDGFSIHVANTDKKV